MIRYLSKLMGGAPRASYGPALRMPLEIKRTTQTYPKAQPAMRASSSPAPSRPVPKIVVPATPEPEMTEVDDLSSTATAVMEPPAPKARPKAKAKPKAKPKAKAKAKKAEPKAPEVKEAAPPKAKKRSLWGRKKQEPAPEAPVKSVAAPESIEDTVAATVQAVLAETKQNGKVTKKAVTKKTSDGYFQLSPSATPGKQVCIFQAVLFEIPNNWVVEYVSYLNGILIFCTDLKATWAASLFFEFRDNPDVRDAMQIVEDLADQFAQQKENYVTHSKQEVDHPNGFSLGVLEYGHTKDGTDLVEWEMVIPYHDHLQLCISAASAKADWSRNQPLFKDVLKSIAPQPM